MNLLLFTSQYPFDGGEAFVEDEVIEISKFFDRVVVYSHADSSRIIRSLPANVQVIRTKDYESVTVKLLAFLKLFCLGTFKELLFILKNLNQSINIRKLHYIYMYYKEETVIKRLFKDHDFSDDLCYSYWFDCRSYAISRLKQIHPEIKLVCRAHRVDSIPTNYNPFRREILSEIDCIFPISETAKKEVEETERLSGVKGKTNIRVSRLGIKRNDKIVNRINNRNLFRIVSCSSIIPRKRLDLIIGAIAEIKNRSVEIEWVHFGDGIKKTKFERLAFTKLRHRKNIKFVFMGDINKNDILKYYAEKQVDVFINASDSEGVPVSIMEAMSYGIPCICRDVGGNAEIVNNGVNGYVVGSDNIMDLASAVETVINSPTEEKIGMRRNAYETYLSLYNGELNYYGHAMLLKKVFEGAL